MEISIITTFKRASSGRTAAILTPTAYFFAGFIVIVMLAGGSSRADVLGQIVVRLAAVGLTATVLATRGPTLTRAARGPALLLAGLAAIAAIQLIPLPPALWMRLPGRDILMPALTDIGVADVWRPVSLAPDATLNALLSILPAFAACLGISAIRPEARPQVTLLLLAAIAASGLLGVVQVTSGSGYIFPYRNEGLAVGFFANRNHQAVFLVCAMPLLAWWSSRTLDVRRRWLAFAFGITLFPLILITGSRAGLLIGLLAAPASLALAWRSGVDPGHRAHRRPGRSRSARWIPVAIGAVAVLLVALLFLTSARDLAVQRLVQGGVRDETRFDLLPVFGRIIVDYLPTGTGFGAFDPVFRQYEPFTALKVTYLNHAHDDPVELLIEAGIGGILLIAAALYWLFRTTLNVIRASGQARELLLARSAVLILLVLLAGSVFDYPVRTPILSVVLTICAILAGEPNEPSEHREAERREFSGSARRGRPG